MARQKGVKSDCGSDVGKEAIAVRLEQLRATKAPKRAWWGVLLMGMLAAGVACWRFKSLGSG